ncbi:class E sortase [Demequina sp. NBRC 110056]|uniref:class E sortase n=1 Tax=Demequina sp. NBRC 110056 TaxID=1570345 RepID=UPI000A06E46C|nr:class E sortase [Demequina sp. NBRC 110056]
MSAPTSSPAPADERPPAHAGRSRPRVSVLGILGELLILAGALLGLFVVWQLFWTDIQGERAQREVVESLDWVEPDVVSGITADEASGPETIPDELKRTDDPPAMDYPEFVETFATFMVPRWGEDYVKPITEGVTRADVLDPLGIGHYPDTALPGEIGNFAISGHRTTYGKPFADVSELEEGDSLIVQTEDAWFVYHVESWEIVWPTQVEVIAPTPDQPGVEPTERYITMTTCHPKFSAAQRWVVHGTMDYWAPVGHGVPEELLEVPA